MLFSWFLWHRYAPAQINGGSRNYYTWWTLNVNREVTTWIFFLVLVKLQGGPKSDEIWHIFRPRPQTFCSYSRTRQNIVILKKTVHCCPRLNVRIHSSKVELAAAGLCVFGGHVTVDSRHVTIGTPMVIFAVLTVSWLFLIVFDHYCTNRHRSTKTVPIVYQQCTNRQKQSKTVKRQ